MLTGAPPFEGETPAEVLVKHIRETPGLAKLPAEVRPTVGWLLEKEASARPAGAEALVGDLLQEDPVNWAALPRLLRSLEGSRELEVGPAAADRGRPAHSTPQRETLRGRPNRWLIRLSIFLIGYYVVSFSVLAPANR